MVYLKNVFESQIQSLCPEGFEKDKNLSLFKRVEKTNIKRIHISANEYFPHSAQVVGVSVDIKFDAIENILNPLLLKYGLTESISTIGKVMNDVKDVNYSVLDTETRRNRSLYSRSHLIAKIYADIKAGRSS